ncbi:MAG: hypothetical protein P1V18_01270 [Candidatus Gracilibacteria bacterium]|nr:hypothetical protein [Candidatus Gracilibacteria bacterium]
MTDTPSSDVPENLKKSRESKNLAAQAAEDQLRSEVPHGERVIVALGYVSFLCILPLVLLQDSKFAQFHGKQALVLAIFIYFFDHLEILPATFISAYTLIKFVVVILAVYKSLKGKYFKIPFIYKLSDRFQINIKSKEAHSDANPA